MCKVHLLLWKDDKQANLMEQREGGAEGQFALWKLLLEVPDNIVYCCEDTWAVSDTVSLWKLKRKAAVWMIRPNKIILKEIYLQPLIRQSLRVRVLFFVQSLDLNVTAGVIVVEAEKHKCLRMMLFYSQHSWLLFMYLSPCSSLSFGNSLQRSVNLKPPSN